MNHQGRFELHQDREGRGGGRRGSDHHHGGSRAQTFRRGRIIVFLEQLRVKRATLARQLGKPEFESIKPVLCGELKALDQVIEEYIHLFELQVDELAAEGDSSTVGSIEREND